MNSKLPSKAEFIKKLGKTKATKEDKALVSVVYDFSLHHHLKAPARATGEHYFWHIYRASTSMLNDFILLGIFDLRMLLIEILHDVIEDARKAGFDPELVYRNVVRKFSAEIAYGTMAITKRDGEHSHDALKRLITEHYWRSHGAKAYDREDNLTTLHGMTLESQERKLAETEKYFPAIFNRLEAEIRIRVECGALPKEWLRLTPILRERQKCLVEENRKRIAKEKKRLLRLRR